MKIFFAATIPESIMAKAIAPLAFTSFASGEFFHTKFSQVQFHCLCTEISFAVGFKYINCQVPLAGISKPPEK